MSEEKVSGPFAKFQCSMPFTSYVFKDGNRVQFTGYDLVLRKQEYIDELREEADDPNNIFITEDKNAKDDGGDPLASLRARIIEEYEAQKAKDSIGKEASSYGTEAKTNVVTTNDTAKMEANARTIQVPETVKLDIKVGPKE